MVVTLVRAIYKNDSSNDYVVRTVAEKEITKRLHSYGLLDNEIEVYLLLVKAGHSTAGIIARRLGTNRMNVYRTLKVLGEKGLVESNVGRPLRFSALPVINYLNRYIEESKTRTSSLESGRDELVNYFTHLHEVEPLTEEPKFRIVQGRKHIHDQILKMLDNARKEVVLIQTQNGLYRFIYRGIDDKLKELHNKGVEIRVLTEIEQAGVEAVKNYLDFAQVRHAALQFPTRLVLVDEVETLTTFAREDSMSLTTEKEVAMWVRASDYAKSTKMFFEILWKGGLLAQAKVTEIEAQEALKEGLDWIQRTLSADGWTTMIPGKLTGESGVEHSFDLAAKYPDNPKMSIVVDSLVEHGSSQILAFSLKALDVGATVQFLVTNLPPNLEEQKLALHRGIKLIFATKSQQLATKIAQEAKKMLKHSNKTT